ERYRAWLEDHPEADLADICFSANTGRSHFGQRAAVVAASCFQVKSRLAALASGDELPTHTGSGSAPRIAFVFSDETALDLTRIRELHALQPVFRKALERCSDLLRDELRPTLLETLLDDAPLLNQP